MNLIINRMGPDRLRHGVSALIMWSLAITLLAEQPTFAQDTQNTTRSTDDTFAGESAWQVDEKLGEKWQDLTGRFIFQRTCLPCHKQGPASFTQTEWKAKLHGFPDEGHTALLPKEFEDLTAMFPYGRMVANDQARYQSLEVFLLKHAPEKKAVVPAEDLNDAADLLPTVGQVAPDFSIVDIEGKKHTLKSYTQDKKTLILVFSRAHW